MTDGDKNRRDNDARQSSEVDPALGQDEREFGRRPETGCDPTVPGLEPEPTASRH